MKFKVIFCLLFFFLFSLFVINPVNAQELKSQNYLNTNPDVPQNLHTHAQSIFIELGSAISCQLTGVDPTSVDGRCLGKDPKTGKIGYVESNGGAIGLVGNLMAATFYIPISTHDYGSYLASNFGITKKTYAADDPVNSALPQTQPSQEPEGSLGFNQLLPTLNLWKGFRNITYLLFVMLFVIVGLGIMFRIKIDPRTVMTLQNQIPKIIMAIVFVTFSYAIAGFLVDLMYVSTYIIISIFAQQGTDTSSVYSATSPFGAIGGLGGMSGISSGVAHTIGGVVKTMFDGTLGNVVAGVITGIFGSFIGGTGGGILQAGATVGSTLGKFGGLFGSFAGLAIGGVVGLVAGKTILGVVAGVIVYIVVIIAIFQALLRLWFQLIKCYIFILMGVVFAPFYIASGLIPGRSGIGAWIRSMLSNLVVFPATITVFLLGKTFTDAFSRSEPGSTPFVPPLTGDFLDPQRFASIIGLGIILMAPEVVNMVRDAVKAPEFKYSSAIGKSLGAGASATTGTARSMGSTYETFTTSGQQKLARTGVKAVIGNLFGR